MIVLITPAAAVTRQVRAALSNDTLASPKMQDVMKHPMITLAAGAATLAMLTACGQALPAIPYRA